MRRQSDEPAFGRLNPMVSAQLPPPGGVTQSSAKRRRESLPLLAVPVSSHLGLSAAQEGEGREQTTELFKIPFSKSSIRSVLCTDCMSLGNVNTVRPQPPAGCDAEAHFGGHEKNLCVTVTDEKC